MDMRSLVLVRQSIVKWHADCHKSFGVYVFFFGCIFLMPAIFIWNDYTDTDESLAADAWKDFNAVDGGCLVAQVRPRSQRICTAFCASNRHKKYTRDRYFDVTYSFSAAPGNTYNDSYYIGRGVPFPEQSPFVIGKTIPCWRSHVQPVPLFYRCGCRSWTLKFCHDVQDECVIVRDPSVELQNVRGPTLRHLIYSVCFFVLAGALILGGCTCVIKSHLHDRGSRQIQWMDCDPVRADVCLVESVSAREDTDHRFLSGGERNDTTPMFNPTRCE